MKIYQLNYICIQSNPRKKITGGFIHKFLANYVSLSVLWDITLTIYQHICLHSHFTSYRYWESFFFFLNDVTLFTFLSLFKRKIILPLRWIELNTPNVVGMKGVNHTQIFKSVGAQIFFWLCRSEVERHWAPSAPVCWEVSAAQSVVCVCLRFRDPFPAPWWCLWSSHHGAELKPEQDQCPRGQTAPGSVPRNAALLCSGFSWLWSVWETWSKIICSSWEFRYKSLPIVPFCNMQIIMNICIFLHFCVWYMYYLRQML